MNFVFYDTETTGTDTTFDQILQFAAIFTDEDFNELDRFEIRCRLLPHVVPAPGALLATRVTPAMLTDLSLSTHYETMLRITEKLREWSPAIFVGYNTLAFDEPLLRQAFYQTLQPIYLTNTNGNQRADVLRLAQATAALAPNAIVIPINHNERPTLRLDMLAPANGFDHVNAHDALADVEATIHIARLIRDRAPNVWSALLPMVDKAEVTARVFSGVPVCWVDYHMGRPSIRAVVGCGHHPENNTMLAVFDLNCKPNEVLALDVDDLVDEMKGKDRVIRVVYANKMPALVPIEVAADVAATFDMNQLEMATRARQVVAEEQFARRVELAMAERYPPFEPAHIVEQRIYEGFPGKSEERLMEAFHAANWDERAKLAEKFEDDRLRELGRRLIFENAPSVLQPDLQENLQQWLKFRTNGREGVKAGRTVTNALADIEKAEALFPSQPEQIADIRDWLTTRAAE